MTLEQDIRRLSAIPLLALLGTEALRLIAFSADTRPMRPGDVLFRRGDAAEGGYLLLAGSVGMDGPEGSLTVVNAGALIGERALITEMARPATATAREAGSVLRITRRLFYRVLAEFPGSAERLRAHLAADIAARLRS